MIDTLTYLRDKYGLRMTLEQVASEINMSVHTLRNQQYLGKLPFPSYKDDGKRVTFVNTETLADYIDSRNA